MVRCVHAKERRIRWIVGLGVAALAVVAVLGAAQQREEELLAEIRAEIIPEEGTGTTYGTPSPSILCRSSSNGGTRSSLRSRQTRAT